MIDEEQMFFEEEAPAEKFNPYHVAWKSEENDYDATVRAILMKDLCVKHPAEALVVAARHPPWGVELTWDEIVWLLAKGKNEDVSDPKTYKRIMECARKRYQRGLKDLRDGARTRKMRWPLD